MSNRTLLTIVIFLGFCVALAATNPTRREYGSFLHASLNEALQRMDHTEPANQRKIIRDVLMTQGKRVIESLLYSHTVRRNYGLFSIFETRAFDVRVVVVGVGMNFFPIDGKEEIAKKLGQLVL